MTGMISAMQIKYFFLEKNYCKSEYYQVSSCKLTLQLIIYVCMQKNQFPGFPDYFVLYEYHTLKFRNNLKNKSYQQYNHDYILDTYLG